MKVVITADTHFGHSDHLGRINPQTGLHTRLEDFFRNFDIIVDYVLEATNNVDLFIIAGDLYKTRHPTNTQQEEFGKRLRKLQDKQKRTLILVGNHDIVVSEGASHTAGIIGALADDKYVKVIDKPCVYALPGINVALMPYIYRQKLGVKTNEEALQYYQDTLKKFKLEEGRKLLIGHQTLAGAHIPSGYIDPEQINEIVIPQSFISSFDFAIFGHIHEHQVVFKNPTTIYTGPLERVDFSQADKPVGFVVYDTESNTFEFKHLPAVDLYKVKLDLTDGKGDLTQRIIDAIDKERLPQSIFRLEYKIRETDLSKINKATLQEIMDKARFNAGIIPDVQREQTQRNGEINETLSAVEALKKYIESRDDIKDISDDLLKRGADIIKLCDLNR